MAVTNTPIGSINTSTSTQTELPEPTYTPVSNPKTSLRDYLAEVRLIKDGNDLVDSDFTNRPHKDIINNIDTLANLADINAMDSCGEWSVTKTYQKGQIVSFLSEYFVSLQDTNSRQMPIPSSAQKTDLWWKVIANSKDIVVDDYTYKEGKDEITTTAGYTPLTNGKSMRFFELKGGRRYTLYMMSRGNPFKERFNLYFDFEIKRNATFSMQSGEVMTLTEVLADDTYELPDISDISYPAVSYIECEVTYTGLKYSQNGLDLPEIRFHSVNDSVLNRKLDLSKAYNKVYDNYGHYGVIFQSNLRNDGLVSVTVTPKWDCIAIVSGNYNMSPYFSDETGSVTGTPKVSVYHKVRPFGGDNGELIMQPYIPAIKLTSKMAWDMGLVKLANLGITSKATATIDVLNTDYPKVVAMANQLNYNGDYDSTKDAGYNYSKVSVDFSKCFGSDAQVIGDNYIKLF